MLVACPDLEDPGDPVVVRLLPRLVVVVWFLLPFDGRAVRDEDEAFAVVFGAVY